MDLGRKISVMHSDFTKKLGFYVQQTNIGAQKIDTSKLDTFDMVITFFLVQDKGKRSCFSKETFLLAIISMNITLGIFFLTWNNIKIDFVGQHYL